MCVKQRLCSHGLDLAIKNQLSITSKRVGVFTEHSVVSDDCVFFQVMFSVLVASLVGVLYLWLH